MITDYFNSDIVTKRATDTDNGFGGVIKTWSTNLSFKGLVDYISGKKEEIASQYADKATHVLICAKGKDILISDKVFYNNEYYRILHVDTPFNRHMEILLEYVGVDNV